uniref:Uncharacterized protein n=1 Tax=Panagrolaimus sp. ES5 TaxID=591445 RepID=A0AC34FQK1_9BILA
MESEYKNKFRKQFLLVAKWNGILNVRILGVRQALLCGALDELSIDMPKNDDILWIFLVSDDGIRLHIWKFDNKTKGWKFEKSYGQEKADKDEYLTRTELEQLKAKIENIYEDGIIAAWLNADGKLKVNVVFDVNGIFSLHVCYPTEGSGNELGKIQNFCNIL